MSFLAKSKFFDDPASKVRHWLLHREQKMMRAVIGRKYEDVLDPQVYWIAGTDNEHDGLSDDQIERMAQRLSLSQIGVFLAQRIWAKRTWLVVPMLMLAGLLITYMLVNAAGTTTSDKLIPLVLTGTVWLSFFLCCSATIFGPLIAQLFLPKMPVRQDEIDSVKSVISRCVIRNVEPETPLDLKDRARLLVTDSDGKSVAGQVLATDLEFSAVRAEWMITKAVLVLMGLVMLSPVLATSSPMLAVLDYFSLLVWQKMAFWIPRDHEQSKSGQQEKDSSVLFFALKVVIIPLLIIFGLSASYREHLDAFVRLDAQVINWVYVIGMWAFAIYLTFTAKSPLKVRAMLLDQAVRESGTELLVDKVGRAYFQHLEEARTEQIRNAKKDGSPFIHLGTSTGLLAQRRDPLSPTEAGIPFGLSVTDLATHVGVLGASGTGKTSGVIRPLTKQWIDGDLGGLLVLDGKGALPLEFDGTEGYTLISPDHGPFNPISGMTPDALADVLPDVCDDGKGDTFWRDSARLMLRMAAILVEAHPNLPYTLTQIQQFCLASHQERADWLDPISTEIDGSGRLLAAAHYWLLEYPDFPEKTAGCISNMLRTWLGNILLQEKLGPWVNTTDTEFRVENVMTGQKIGLLLPESEYGIGGVAISAICMRRVYDAVKKRGDSWKGLEGHRPVLLAADEVQNLLTKADLETVPVARSLGLYLMFATQNVDGLYKRLERDGAVQMLGNLASIIALAPRTDDSNNYVSKRVGNVWKASTQSFQGLPDAASDFGLYANSGTGQAMQSTTLHRQNRFGAPRLSYAIGLWHRQWTPKAMNWLDGMVVPDDPHQAPPRPALQLELSPLISPDEIDTLLAIPGTAIAIINRARIQRRDVIRLYPKQTRDAA
ncbi:type IV secretory system conjugative DNA transfer family protein [Pseudomonas syringae]|uniref:type IV secretory system conjugative DNA transfer family protein n=1 Tax=Pseudomonas syringae TaxID=317 RepID=UPI000E32069E|nr:TraM recognition domain-containing protein [Pseudomonas syringae]